MSHAEADLRARLRELSELETRQQANDLAEKHRITRGDVLALWRQEHRTTAAEKTAKGELKLAGRPVRTANFSCRRTCS